MNLTLHTNLRLKAFERAHSLLHANNEPTFCQLHGIIVEKTVLDKDLHVALTGVKHPAVPGLCRRRTPTCANHIIQQPVVLPTVCIRILAGAWGGCGGATGGGSHYNAVRPNTADSNLTETTAND